MKNFKQLGSVLLKAFVSYSNPIELVNKKLDILNKTTDANFNGKYLFVGFSPACLQINREFYITEVEQDVLDFFNMKRLKYKYVDLKQVENKSFDYTVALDEFFTFAENEQAQQSNIDLLARLTKQRLVTSLRDYKNQDHRDKDFSTPVLITNHQQKTIFLECHDHTQGHAFWHSSVYELADGQATFYGPFARLPVYFKQLAKFSYDAGATNFLVEKKLMYKGLIRKNFEHVITITY